MLVDKFLMYIRAEKRYAENTAQNYERDIRRFMEYIREMSNSPKESFYSDDPSAGGFDPTIISQDDIRGWIILLSEGGLAPASVNRMTSSLRSFFRWLRKTGKLNHDPFSNIGFQKKPTRLPSFIPEKQMDLLIDKLEEDSLADSFTVQRNALIILLFYTTGIRLSELVGLSAGDFSSDFRELKIRGGKGGKDRVVPLLEFTRHKILAYLDRIKEENICISPGISLFLTKKGKPVSRYEIYRIVKRELTKAGIQGKRSPHVLRHTFATHMLNDGADIREIQELLGHSSLAATQVYTHNSITKLMEVYRSAHPRGVGKKVNKP